MQYRRRNLIVSYMSRMSTQAERKADSFDGAVCVNERVACGLSQACCGRIDLAPLIPLLLMHMQLWPIRKRGRYAFVVIADCPTFFRYARGRCVAPALDNPAPRSDDRVLGWVPRRPRVLKHSAFVRGGDCFRPERRTQSAGLASSARLVL